MSNTTAAKITEADLREVFGQLAEEWTLARANLGASPFQYKLVKVSGTARYDHWAIQQVSGDRSGVGTYVNGFEDMGGLRTSHALLRGALISIRMGSLR